MPDLSPRNRESLLALLSGGKSAKPGLSLSVTHITSGRGDVEGAGRNQGLSRPS